MTPRYLTCIAAILILGQNLVAQDASCQPCKTTPQPCIQAEPIVDCCKYPPAFNAAAAIDVSTCGWDLFADASFLYWHASEEGLELAVNAVFASPGAFLSPNTSPLFQTFGYHPGFKVGLGFIANRQWQVRADYTWLRGSNSLSANAPTTFNQVSGQSSALVATTGLPVWEVDAWFLQSTSNTQAIAASNVASTWKYAIDFVDAVVSRPYYQGSSLTIAPFGGLRAAWIRQSLVVALTEIPDLFPGTTPTQPLFSHNNSQCWGIGPKIGFDGFCLLPMGFRIEGSLATDLLYTRYTKIAHSEDPVSTAYNPGPYVTNIHDYNCLRSMAELGLGLGWGQYFACQKYHLDFSASYDFTYMWRQNMMRLLVDEVQTSIGTAASDFFLHGLTINGRFDF